MESIVNQGARAASPLNSRLGGPLYRGTAKNPCCAQGCTDGETAAIAGLHAHSLTFLAPFRQACLKRNEVQRGLGTTVIRDHVVSVELTFRPKDDTRAAQLYRKAYRGGDSSACHN